MKPIKSNNIALFSGRRSWPAICSPSTTTKSPGAKSSSLSSRATSWTPSSPASPTCRPRSPRKRPPSSTRACRRSPSRTSSVWSRKCLRSWPRRWRCRTWPTWTSSWWSRSSASRTRSTTIAASRRSWCRSSTRSAWPAIWTRIFSSRTRWSRRTPLRRPAAYRTSKTLTGTVIISANLSESSLVNS